MPQEFKVKNGLIVDQGGAIITGSVTATSGFTGSLFGTASYATQALSASFAPQTPTFPFTGSAIVSGSLTITGSLQVGVPGVNNPAIDSSVGTLSRGTQTKVDWVNSWLVNSSNIIIVDWENALLSDTSGNSSADATNRTLYDSSGTSISIDWENRNSYDTPGVLSIDWGGRQLTDTVGGISIDWGNRVLPDATSTYIALDYNNYPKITSELYYNNIIPTAVQDSIADNANTAGQIIEGTVDASVLDYNLVFLDTDGIWYPTKNDVAGRATKMQGICVDVAKDLVLIEGDVGVSDDNTQGAYVVGADHGLPVYMSGTVGEMTTTQPASGFIRIVGHIYRQSAIDTRLWVMKFRPSNDWYEI